MILCKEISSFLARKMVDEQIIKRGISDKKVVEAMLHVPREEFVLEAWKREAYEDSPLPIGEGQTISQPYIVALMTQLLELEGNEKVLEIGTGSGYQAAILSRLAREVCTMERNQRLLARAEIVFAKLGMGNIKTKHNDGSLGWSEHAPYDAIIVTAAARKIPPALVDQLTEGGRLVIPVGPNGWQELIKYTKKGGELIKEGFGSCVFVPLVEGEAE